MSDFLISKLTIDPFSGAELKKVCERAYDLSRQLGVPIEVLHNDRRYKVGLSIQECGAARPELRPCAVEACERCGKLRYCGIWVCAEHSQKIQIHWNYGDKCGPANAEPTAEPNPPEAKA